MGSFFDALPIPESVAGGPALLLTSALCLGSRMVSTGLCFNKSNRWAGVLPYLFDHLVNLLSILLIDFFASAQPVRNHLFDVSAHFVPELTSSLGI